MSPYLQRPIELGASYVVHSTSKFINGHGTAVGGIIVASKKRLEKLRSWYHITVPVMEPLESFTIMQGLETLSIRMERHCDNAEEVVAYLNNHPKISRVHYPGLANFPQHQLAQKQMDRYGSLIAFEMKDGFPAGKKLMDFIGKKVNTTTLTLAVSLGTIDSLIQHPASMTHAIIPKAEILKAGITDGLIRLSVGCRDVDKNGLIDDLDKALNNV